MVLLSLLVIGYYFTPRFKINQNVKMNENFLIQTRLHSLTVDLKRFFIVLNFHDYLMFSIWNYINLETIDLKNMTRS